MCMEIIHRLYRERPYLEYRDKIKLQSYSSGYTGWQIQASCFNSQGLERKMLQNQEVWQKTSSAFQSIGKGESQVAVGIGAHCTSF